MLNPVAGVVITRAHAHFVITEYGAVDLFGKNLRQRAHALISIAHPEEGEMLERAAFYFIDSHKVSSLHAQNHYQDKYQ